MQSHLPLTFGDDLERNAHFYPDITAFAYADRRLTHAQFLDRAKRLSSGIHNLGVRRQDRVSILAQNCLEYVEIYGACEWAGYIAATLNFRLSASELKVIINDAGPKILFFEAGYAATVDSIRDALYSVEHFVCIPDGASEVPAWAVSYESVLADGAADGAPCRSREEDIAYLIYTSGTTGRPKGCMLGQREARRSALGLTLAHGNTSDDRTLLMMPFFHVGAKFMQNAQHAVGGTVFIQRGFDAEAVLKCIDTNRITTTHMAPMMVQMLLDSPKLKEFDIDSLRAIVYGAAPMPLPVLRKGLELLGPVFIQTYGQTEVPGTTLAGHEHRPDGDDRERKWLQSVGRPYHDLQLRVVDDNGNECPSGTPGEIAIRGGAMFRGYWNNSQATLETIRDGWVHTGDIGKVDEEGFVYLVDRKKDMIISGGENIYSREVEEAIVLHPAVSECAVIGIPDDKWGESVCAVIVLREGYSVTTEEVIEHCRKLIASYKKPKKVVFADSIPKLPSGKVSKVELRKLHVA